MIGDINVLWEMSGEILLLAIPTSMLFSSRATFVSLYGTDTKVSALCHDCGVRWTKGAKHVGNPGYVEEVKFNASRPWQRLHRALLEEVEVLYYDYWIFANWDHGYSQLLSLTSAP